MNVMQKAKKLWRVTSATLLYFALLLISESCVDGRNFDALEVDCSSDLEANATYAEVKALYTGETLQIQQDLVIEGYVLSSDKAGNYFSVLHFQDSPENPRDGFQIEIDLRDSHLFYPVGSKIYIKLKGLYLGQSRGIFKLGGVFTSFGNASVGRLPAAIIHQHIFNSCDPVAAIVPTEISLADNLEERLNTYVTLDRLELISEQLGLAFALDGEATERTLIDCLDQEIILLNSGFSDFQSALLPSGSGSISALLQKQNNDYFLVINDTTDLNFSQERCEDLVDEFTSNRVFISEIADPNNNADARFIELYNADTLAISLKGWRLDRYTNDNTEVGTSINLSDFSIPPSGTLVIANNGTVFEAVYGFAPDDIGGAGSAADSNGDDIIVLVDPFGEQIDIFGVIGQDGSGTNHEFEDGRAYRKPLIEFANPVYTFSEWEIYNDTGGSGTVNLAQNAPQDFTPKVR